MRQDFKYMVCTHCITYNHAPFIVDAMKGFVMQETTFPVVTVIVDDASTDDEQGVIKRYLDVNFDKPFRCEETDYAHIICANHKTNDNCQFVVVFLKYNHYSTGKDRTQYLKEWLDKSKYYALCEGDDYWNSPIKLQKMVCFLEEHPEYNICSHDYSIYFENKKKEADESVYSYLFSKMSIEKTYLDFSLDDYFKRSYLRTMSYVCRNGEYLDKIPIAKYKYYRDDIFHYYLLKQGKGALLRDVFGVYRIHDGGAWSAIRNLPESHESAIYNAYNIFIVEKDNRALYKVKAETVELLIMLIQRKMYRRCFERIKISYRDLPFKDFVFIIFQTLKRQTKNSIKRLFRV